MAWQKQVNNVNDKRCLCFLPSGTIAVVMRDAAVNIIAMATFTALATHIGVVLAVGINFSVDSITNLTNCCRSCCRPCCRP